MRFSDLQLNDSLRQAVAEQGYERPTPIQARAIPPALEGRDILGCAQTGTGKTAAFALPILHHLAAEPVPGTGRRAPRALVVAPTRELAAQIAESFEVYGRHLHLRTAVVFGGVGQRPQEEELRRGVDVLVACPGRLLDLMNQRHADLGSVRFLVLDEADRMLDMGFLPDIKRIVAKVPEKRQTLFFSATMPSEIRTLVGNLLKDPVTIEVAPVSSAAETVDQSVLHLSREEKIDRLVEVLRGSEGRTIVFTRTKHGADRVVRKLDRSGLPSAAIHGDKSQGARTKALEGFRDGSIPVLVASDIAARGLDIDEIRLVVNHDIPADPETYVHRIGRTGRAGATGRAVTFVTPDDLEALRDVEKLLGRRIPVYAQGEVVASPSPRSAERVAPAPAAKPAEAPRVSAEGEGRKRRRRRGKGGSEASAPRAEAPAESGARHAKGPRSEQGGRKASGNGEARAPRSGDSNRSRRRDDRPRDGRGRGHSTSEARPVAERSAPALLPSGRPQPRLSQGEGLLGKIWSRIKGQ